MGASFGPTKAVLPAGTTAQRPSSPSEGTIWYNTTIDLAEYYNGSGWIAIDAPPTVSSISPSNIGDSQSSVNIVITGNNFKSGATVTAIGADASTISAGTVTVDSSTQITATFDGTSFDNAQEDYDIKVTNSSGLSSVLADCLSVNETPAWTTASGQIGGEIFEGDSVSTSIAATDSEGASLTYGIKSGTSLPSGLSINSSTGAITGTAPSVSSDTTTTFTGTVSDGTNTAERSFNIVVKDDTLTNGLIALYATGNTADTSGNGYNGTVVGTATTYTDSGTPYGSRTVTQFPDSSGYISLPSATAITGSNDRTITCWVKPNASLNSNDYIFGFGSDNICNGATFNARCNDNKMSFMGCARDHDSYGPTIYSTGTWVRIFYTYNGTTLGAYYLDGSGNRQTAWTWNATLSTSMASGGVARIGSHATGNTADNVGCNSRICDFRIYNRVLTQTEMERLYNY